MIDFYSSSDDNSSVIYNENNRNVTYSYTDVLTRTVEVDVYDGEAYSPLIPPPVETKRKKAEVSLEDALNYDAEGNELHLEDILGTDENLVPDEYEKQVDKEILSKEIEDLQDRDKEIMTLRYGLNNTKEYTQKEVAASLGISRSYVSRIEKGAIQKLRPCFLPSHFFFFLV